MPLKLISIAYLALLLIAPCASLAEQTGHTGTHAPSAQTGARAVLNPAEGARVAIVVPAPGTVLQKDAVPLEFRLTRGRRGEHVHAYVDGELMGMFKSERGTLTGISPGTHVLELRVAAEDHKTELDATDRVEFTVVD